VLSHLKRFGHVGTIQRVLGMAAAATLALDAYAHLHNAGIYDAVKTSVISQGTLFRIEAIVSIAVAVMLLVSPRRIWWAVSILVLATAFGAVMLYRYVDLGVLGPLPNMYEPTWVISWKLASAWAEAAGAVVSVIGLLAGIHIQRRGAHPLHATPRPRNLASIRR
jgi:hypothetical protein